MSLFDKLTRRGIKMLIPTVIDFLPMLDEAVAEYRKEWLEKVKPESGFDIVAVLFHAEEKTFVSISLMSPTNQITTQLETMTFSDFVLSMINKYNSIDKLPPANSDNSHLRKLE